MRISHKYNFIFLSKYRCASQSIRQFLDPYSDIKSTQKYPFYHHSTAYELKQYFDKEGYQWKDYFKFISIRNPWDMLVSLFHFGQPDRDCRFYWERHWDMLQSRGKVPKEYRFPDYPIDFEDWIKKRDFTKFKLDYFIFDSRGNSLVDFIVKRETIKKDIFTVCSRLGIPYAPPQISNQTDHSDYHSYYNDATREIVRKTFQCDIEVGGYTF